MYIYHALINALSAHMIHINLNMIFYICNTFSECLIFPVETKYATLCELFVLLQPLPTTPYWRVRAV